MCLSYLLGVKNAVIVPLKDSFQNFRRVPPSFSYGILHSLPRNNMTWFKFVTNQIRVLPPPRFRQPKVTLLSLPMAEQFNRFFLFFQKSPIASGACALTTKGRATKMLPRKVLSE